MSHGQQEAASPAGVQVPPLAHGPDPTAGREALTDPAGIAVSTDRLLDDLLAWLCQVMDVEVAQFLLVDGDYLRVASTRGIALDFVASLRIPVGAGFTGSIAASAAPATLDDTSTLPTFGRSWAEEGVPSVAGAPLIVDGEVIGVVLVGSRTGRRFTEEDVRLLSAAAERAASAGRHGLLLAAEQRAREAAASAGERLRRLQAMSQELLNEPTVDAVIRTVVDRGLSLIGAIAGSVWEVDHEAGVLRLRGVLGYPDEVVRRWRDLTLDARAPAADAARTGERVVLWSIEERNTRYPSLRGGAAVGEAFVAAPLVIDGRTIGVLGLGIGRADELDGEAMAFIDAAAAQCAAAMHRAVISEMQQRSLAEAQQTARRLASLQRLTAALADARDEGAVLDLLVNEVTGALGVRQLALCLLDRAARVMRAARFHGLDEALERRFAVFPYGTGLPAADALLRRQPIILRDRAERDTTYPAFTGNPMPNSWISLPLAVGSREIGALSLSVPTSHEVGDDDIGFFMALADQCAHALERTRLLALESAHRGRLEVLAEAGRIFAAPLDVRLTSLQFCRLVVGRIADAAVVYLCRPERGYQLAAVVHRDPTVADVVRELSAGLPKEVVDMFDELLEDIADRPPVRACVEDLLLTTAEDPVRDVLATPTVRSGMLLPLVAGGQALGVLSVSTVDGGHAPLADDDVDQMKELAARLAVALDAARLLRQQTEIAHTLQRSLLPSSLPQVPGAEVAVRYLPGAEGVDVGGDFYDVIPLPSGRIGLVVGDVMGRGVRAAAVMGQLRAAVRSYSLEGHSPAALLTRLDRLVGTLEEGLLVTALYAEWDPSRGQVLCACAGHLPPLVRRPGERPAYVDIDPGVPLGVGMESHVEVELELAPGTLLLAFTDGLVEGPELPVEDGMRRLEDALTDVDGAMDACDTALAELRPPGDRRYDDDTALLALVTHSATAHPVALPDDHNTITIDLPADTTSPGRARGLVADSLYRWGLHELTDTATLLTSELVTNAVRHAGTGMRLRVARHSEGRVRIAVSDRASGSAVRIRALSDETEDGRGLFLVEHLSSGWGSMSDDAGKTVWFELQA